MAGGGGGGGRGGSGEVALHAALGSPGVYQRHKDELTGASPAAGAQPDAASPQPQGEAVSRGLSGVLRRGRSAAMLIERQQQREGPRRCTPVASCWRVLVSSALQRRASQLPPQRGVFAQGVDGVHTLSCSTDTLCGLPAASDRQLQLRKRKRCQVLPGSAARMSCARSAHRCQGSKPPATNK